MKKAFVNARILEPAAQMDITGGLYIENQHVKAIGHDVTADNLAADVEVIDVKGKGLLPGIIDFRCQIPDPGDEAKGSLSSEGKAALAGGITSLAILPTTEPTIDSPAMVTYMRQRQYQKNDLPKIYPWGAATLKCEGQSLTEIGLMKKEGAIGFTDGHQAIQNAAVLRRALQYASGFDAFIAQHPCDAHLGKGHMNAGSLANRLGLAGMPWQAEVIMIERDLRLLEMTGGSLHFSHISCAASVEIIAKAKEKGLDVTCDTAPPYFTMNENDVSNWRSFAKLNPPLRTEADRLAIVEGLKSGIIDFVASDHIPQDEEAKRLPFDQASFGGVGLESLLPTVLELYHKGALSLLKALALITYKPAERLNIEGGRLQKEGAADFAIVDIDKAYVFDDKALHSRSRNSPFGGRLMQGVVLQTYVNGQLLFEK